MKKLNLTVTVEAIGTVTVEVPDDMTFDDAMAWAQRHKGSIPVPTNPEIIDNIIDIDEDNSDFDDESQPTYQYVELNNQTMGECTHRIRATDGEAINYPAYLCMDGNIKQFKKDVTNAGLWTMDIHMNNGNTVVVAIDFPEIPHVGTSIDQQTIEQTCLNVNRDLPVYDGPFPEARVFEFPVSYEMYGYQSIRAANMTDALKQLENAPLPSTGHYVDESFAIDDDGVIKTHI